jgi:hypothetical protein
VSPKSLHKCMLVVLHDHKLVSPVSALACTLCGNRVDSGAMQEELAVPDHYRTMVDRFSASALGRRSASSRHSVCTGRM